MTAGGLGDDDPAELELIPPNSEDTSPVLGPIMGELSGPPDTVPFDADRYLAEARWRLAKSLLQVLVLVVVLTVAFLGTSRWTKLGVENLRSVFEVMFGSIVTLVSAATGFYFGTGQGGSQRTRPG